MVKFGANEIFHTKEATVTDEDIDKILEAVRCKSLSLLVLVAQRFGCASV